MQILMVAMGVGMIVGAQLGFVGGHTPSQSFGEFLHVTEERQIMLEKARTLLMGATLCDLLTLCAARVCLLDWARPRYWLNQVDLLVLLPKDLQGSWYAYSL